ncbi:MAG: hypothetical protein L3J39_07205 [Verrucomicrobiales bacterium]|nr:hypothetical protein [Verrucomicrobiales bacterium]
MKSSTIIKSLLALSLSLSLLTLSANAQKAFDKTVTLEKVSFRIQCANDSSLNKVKITPKGLADDKAITVEAEGAVTAVEIDDLNNDGFPEIYIAITSAGSGSYGSLIAYASNKNKSITPIYMPELTKEQMKGYMGHDEFAPVEGVLVRNFPVYKDGDSNAKPTGKTRQIQYHLKAGEAGWKFVHSKTFDF